MSFISDYLTYTEGNESPAIYHKWACLSTISVAAGRRFWFKLGRLTYYPHLYVLLVGEPGVKKSTAMDVSKELIQTTAISPIAASQTTREFIGKAMSNDKFKGKRMFQHEGVWQEYNQYAIFATEFTQFISINPEGMLEFFTAVYTEQVHSTDYKNTGSDYVLHPYITLLGCLTPHMLKGYLKMNVLTGGFARRTNMVYGMRDRIIPIPKSPPEGIKERLVEWLLMMQQKSGEYFFGPGAQEWYENWYVNLQTHLKDIAKPSTEGYYITKQEPLIKVAMLIAMSEGNGDSFEILPEHFEFAEKHFFAPMEANLERVFEGAGINPNAAAAAQVCRMLEAMNAPMPRKSIEAMFYGQVTDFRALQDTLQHLLMVGLLESRTVTVNGKLLGDLLAAPGVISRYAGHDLVAFFATIRPPQPSTNMDQSS